MCSWSLDSSSPHCAQTPSDPEVDAITIVDVDTPHHNQLSPIIGLWNWPNRVVHYASTMPNNDAYITETDGTV